MHASQDARASRCQTTLAPHQRKRNPSSPAKALSPLSELKKKRRATKQFLQAPPVNATHREACVCVLLPLSQPMAMRTWAVDSEQI